MNNYEEWANLVAKKLKGEADVIAAIDKDELDDEVATEVFVRIVLKPFLPENFGIGAGRIVDAFGNRSEYFDVVIYNRSFPRIGLRGTQSDYLYESVLAAFAIRAKYVRKTFFESMDACASMARLVTNIDKAVLVKLARRNGLKPGPNRTFIHEDSVRTARFELIGSPPVFMFGFTGIKNSYRQLEENIQLWIEHQKQDDEDLPMRAFPAVIATQGCFAWRNAAPLALSNREMMGVGNDHAPIRLIVLQLLYLLNRGLNVTSDGYGLKPNLSAYLSQFSAPNFEHGVGNVDQLISLKIGYKNHSDADESKRLQPARDHSAPAAAANETVASKPAVNPDPKLAEKPAPKLVEKSVEKSVQQAAVSAAAMSKPAPTVAEPVSPPKPEAEKAESGTSSGVFDKPSPFASAPAPAASSAEKAESGTSSGVFDKPSPFASAPAPAASSAEKAEEPARFKPPTAALGSAPIPGIANPADKETLTQPPVAALSSAPISVADSILDDDSIPPLPPIDIELTDTFPMPEEMPDLLLNNLASELPEDELEDIETRVEPDFEATMIIAPDASSLSTKQSDSSTEAFIERVKGQLSDSSAKPEKDEETFISTVPH